MDGQQITAARRGKVLTSHFPNGVADSLIGILTGKYDLGVEKDGALKDKYVRPVTRG